MTYGLHFEDDKQARNIYRLTLSRGRSRTSFKFGQSIVGTEANEIPTAYDLLATIQKYDPGTFANFCSEFGYDEDSRKALKVYRGVVAEWKQVSRFFSVSELEQLQEIN